MCGNEKSIPLPALLKIACVEPPPSLAVLKSFCRKPFENSGTVDAPFRKPFEIDGAGTRREHKLTAGVSLIR